MSLNDLIAQPEAEEAQSLTVSFLNDEDLPSNSIVWSADSVPGLHSQTHSDDRLITLIII